VNNAFYPMKHQQAALAIMQRLTLYRLFWPIDVWTKSCTV